MAMREYIIQPGDTFYQLAQRWGGTCDDWITANSQLNPLALQVGQKVILPPLSKGADQYVEIFPGQGREFSGEHLDEVEMELGGVQFKLRRIGESRIPHEVHLILPRAEIRKIQPQGENGPTEVQIMLSNVNIVHSPRLMSEGVDQAESGKKQIQPQPQPQIQSQPQFQSQTQVQTQPQMQNQMGINSGFPPVSLSFPGGYQ